MNPTLMPWFESMLANSLRWQQVALFAGGCAQRQWMGAQHDGAKWLARELRALRRTRLDARAPRAHREPLIPEP